ncbi:MAG TPA: hypothetical protein VNK44_04105 [Candidatus Nitrosotenuis sp.]|nr:hypothetical protein [Candidatus Nitrosotenuis sp.]
MVEKLETPRTPTFLAQDLNVNLANISMVVGGKKISPWHNNEGILHDEEGEIEYIGKYDKEIGLLLNFDWYYHAKADGITTEVSYTLKAIDVSSASEETESANIPNWIKNNAKWWYDGKLNDDDFV